MTVTGWGVDLRDHTILTKTNQRTFSYCSMEMNQWIADNIGYSMGIPKKKDTRHEENPVEVIRGK